MKSNKRIIKAILFTSLTLLQNSCTDFLQIDPPAATLTSATVFKDDNTATAAMVNVYINMLQYSENYASGESSLTWLSGLSSDELINYYADSRSEFGLNEIQPENPFISSRWIELYKAIFDINSVLEGLKTSNLSDKVYQQLKGEALFMRAFCYFYLVNFWGEIPLVITTDYKKNSLINKSSPDKVYEQILEDLGEARQLLPGNEVGDKRTRPNKFAVLALLARVYLFTEDWANAALVSTEIISANNTFQLASVESCFIKDSPETIWQLQSFLAYINTWDALGFILTAVPTRVSLSQAMIDSFEPADKRSDNWVGVFTNNNIEYHFPYKYKVRFSASATEAANEYLIVFRLAEQYLIRAEAQAHLGNLTESMNDLNVIRNRAGLHDFQSSDRDQIIDAILQERQSELFTEWSHRWLDLKRTNKINTLAEVKPNWQSTDALYPIPQFEILRNPNIAPQNPGY